MTAYYNDNDPSAAAWLRELMREGHIPEGEVDERSILDVEPSDLAGFHQCHFFAGIGGWAYALRLAGWPDDRPVWTGSPPCQPFSVAGKGLARDDPRHLAPHFLDLVTACRPPFLFGEQVVSANVFGKAAKRARGTACPAPEWAWIDDLYIHMEDAHYAFGTADLPAASVGAPHIRQRCFFGAYDLRPAAGGLANAGGQRCEGERLQLQRRGPQQAVSETAGRGAVDRLADAHGGEPWRSGPIQPGGEHGLQPQGGGVVGLADTDDAGPQGRVSLRERSNQRPARAGGMAVGQPAAGPVNGFWRDADWLRCTDGRWRAVEPGSFPLAHGVSGRVALLRGAGNAIVPQLAAEFIGAFMEVREATA